jgi:hypothetical protein
VWAHLVRFDQRCTELSAARRRSNAAQAVGAGYQGSDYMQINLRATLVEIRYLCVITSS